MSHSLRTITVPAGIGDFCWLACKLGSVNEKFHIKLPDGLPQRGHQILQLLPSLVESYEYTPNLSYKKINENNIQRKKKNWKDIKDNSFYLSANEWLESGKRIEGWLPDLPTSYRLDFATDADDKGIARVLLDDSGAHYIGIYGSAYANARHKHYNGWGPDEWFKFCKLLYSHNRNIKFVIIGADYDEDLATMLMNKFHEFRTPFVNTIGQPLSVVIELLKRLSYFVGFPSGLSILNELLGKDGVMFYGEKVKGIINTWADPERIKAGNIKECLFCDPEQIFDWVKNSYGLFKRLQ